MSQNPQKKEQSPIPILTSAGVTTQGVGLTPRPLQSQTLGQPAHQLRPIPPIPLPATPESPAAREGSELALRWFLLDEIKRLQTADSPEAKLAKKLTTLSASAAESCDEEGMAVSFVAVVRSKKGAHAATVSGNVTLDQCLVPSMLGVASEGVRRVLADGLTSRVTAVVEKTIRETARAATPASDRPTNVPALPQHIRPGEGLSMPDDDDTAPGG